MDLKLVVSSFGQMILRCLDYQKFVVCSDLVIKFDIDDLNVIYNQKYRYANKATIN